MENPTFADAAALYLDRLRALQRRPRTIETAKADLDRIAAVLQDVPLAEFGESDVFTLQNWLNLQGRSPATRNRYLRTLRAALRCAHRKRHAGGRRWLPEIPVIESYKENRQRARGLTPDELRKLFQTNAHRPWLATLLRLLVGTGCRIGEAAHATWGDLAEGEGGTFVLHVRAKPQWDWLPKTHQERSVPLAADLAQRLFRHRETVPHGDSDPIFPGKRGGPWVVNNLTRSVRLAFKRAGLTDKRRCSAHALRRAYATLARQAIDPVTIQQTLGHRSLSTTERYFEVDDAAARRGAEAVSKLLDD